MHTNDIALVQVSHMDFALGGITLEALCRAAVFAGGIVTSLQVALVV